MFSGSGAESGATHTAVSAMMMGDAGILLIDWEEVKLVKESNEYYVLSWCSS